MKEMTVEETTEQQMLEELKWATEQSMMLERDLLAVRNRRDDLILDLLGTKASRPEISEAAKLAPISIYKIAARTRERRARILAEQPARKSRVRKKKPEPVERVMDVPAEVGNFDPVPVIVEVPEGSHPLLGWTLAA